MGRNPFLGVASRCRFIPFHPDLFFQMLPSVSWRPVSVTRDRYPVGYVLGNETRRPQRERSTQNSRRTAVSSACAWLTVPSSTSDLFPRSPRPVSALPLLHPLPSIQASERKLKVKFRDQACAAKLRAVANAEDPGKVSEAGIPSPRGTALSSAADSGSPLPLASPTPNSHPTCCFSSAKFSSSSPAVGAGLWKWLSRAPEGAAWWLVPELRLGAGKGGRSRLWPSPEGSSGKPLLEVSASHLECSTGNLCGFKTLSALKEVESGTRFGAA